VQGTAFGHDRYSGADGPIGLAGLAVRLESLTYEQAKRGRRANREMAYPVISLGRRLRLALGKTADQAREGPGEVPAGSKEPKGREKPMLHVALWEPEIPPNTGNIARLCAATGTTLHLIGRLGFRLDARSVRRAGLDYWDAVELRRHATLADFEAAVGGARLFCYSAGCTTPYTRVAYRAGDVLLFGGESHGLPAGVLERHSDRAMTIPMPAGTVRSLNLATAAGIVLYEALRQILRW
jgi:tRNA (cytidine/uridine-2'-O-)-methyltransferase